MFDNNAIASALDSGLAAVDLTEALATRDALQAEIDEATAALREAEAQETALALRLNEVRTKGADPAKAAHDYMAGAALEELETEETLTARKAQLRPVVIGLRQRIEDLEQRRFREREGVFDQLGTGGDAALEMLGEAARDALAELAVIRALAGVIRGATRSRAEGRLERQLGEALAGWRSEHGAATPSPAVAPEWLVETLERHADKIAAGGGRIRVQLVAAPEPEPERETRKDQGLGSAVYGAGLKAPAGRIEHLATTTL